MRIFDIGFYDGTDSKYYLGRGCEVVAFEANPVLCEAGRRLFAEAIKTGQLQLHNLGIGLESGSDVDFFIHTESEEWSTFYREAAVNWGPGKSRLIKVSCITAAEMFERFGYPDYLKADIEGYDIIVADELRNLATRPDLVSFEASNMGLLKSLGLAGYQSFKLVDQSRVPLQIVKDPTSNAEFRFVGGTGPFGDDAEGEWVCLENAFYLFFRLVLDPFSPSTPAGHWFDLHASMDPSRLDQFQQREYIKKLVCETYGGHCGLQASSTKPTCPAAQANSANASRDEVDRLRQELSAINSSKAWRLVSFLRRMHSALRNSWRYRYS